MTPRRGGLDEGRVWCGGRNEDELRLCQGGRAPSTRCFGRFREKTRVCEEGLTRRLGYTPHYELKGRY